MAALGRDATRLNLARSGHSYGQRQATKPLSLAVLIAKLGARQIIPGLADFLHVPEKRRISVRHSLCPWFDAKAGILLHKFMRPLVVVTKEHSCFGATDDKSVDARDFRAA